MYHVTLTVNLGQAESYADALALVDLHRGDGMVKVHPVLEDGSLGKAIALCTPMGKLMEPLQGPHPNFYKGGAEVDEIK